ncbi:MAG: YceI family protein [Planctomycetota bacterium]
MRSLFLAAVTLLAAFSPFSATTVQGAESHAQPLSSQNTTVSFVGKKTDGAHTGGFKEITGMIRWSGNDLASAKIQVDISTASLYSDNLALTIHLKAPDFFDVKRHPKATFTSTAVSPVNKEKNIYRVQGQLTLLGVTKSIEFPARILVDKESLSLESEFKLDRTLFGMTYGKDKIDAEVEVKIAVKR